MTREEMLAEIAWIEEVLARSTDEGDSDTTFSYPDRNWDDDGPHAA